MDSAILEPEQQVGMIISSHNVQFHHDDTLDKSNPSTHQSSTS